MDIPIEKVYADLESVKDSECSCNKCVAMCTERVCWGTPKDIQHLIDLGYGNRLMRDYWVGNFKFPKPDILSKDYYDIHIICPADVGDEGGYAPSWTFKPCTFLTPDKRCEIHAHKPTEGRKANCNHDSPIVLHAYVARTWDTPEGRAVVEQFEKMRGDD